LSGAGYCFKLDSMPAPERIATLIFGFLREELTESETLELNEWVAASPENQRLFEDLTDTHNLISELADYQKFKALTWQRLQAEIPELRKHKAPDREMNWKMIAAAASIILIILVGAIYLNSRHKKERLMLPKNENALKDIPAGSDKAILTLADGSTVALDSAAIGKITTQGSTQVNKTDSGKLVYNSSPIGGGQVGANTLSTPRGGQYKLILPDGTKVWLNAASTIRFPVAFSGAERKVEVSGEVYFEVIHDPAKPFFVDINSGTASVEVLGTHFNINAYTDEPEIRATLLEGSVKIIQGNKNKLIVPGDQALIATDKGSGILTNSHVDLDDVVAWKNGQTNFSNLSMEAILRIVSRWYDVDIIHESAIPERRLNGGIPRNAPLSDLMKVLEAYQIQTRLEGKKLFVKT